MTLLLPPSKSYLSQLSPNFDMSLMLRDPEIIIIKRLSFAHSYMGKMC